MAKEIKNKERAITPSDNHAGELRGLALFALAYCGMFIFLLGSQQKEAQTSSLDGRINAINAKRTLQDPNITSSSLNDPNAYEARQESRYEVNGVSVGEYIKNK